MEESRLHEAQMMESASKLFRVIRTQVALH
jgi:hypothetical protein